LKEFVESVERGEHPKRVHKPSGVDKKGERFEPYIRLNLWHHHLGLRTGEPLLILQIVGDEVFGFALSSHAKHFQGDKMLWLQEHMDAIDWSDCEDLKVEVAAYRPPKREDKR
jgi:hypothetical protein